MTRSNGRDTVEELSLHPIHVRTLIHTTHRRGFKRCCGRICESLQAMIYSDGTKQKRSLIEIGIKEGGEKL